MKANADKCHLLLSRRNECIANINNVPIYNSLSEKLLGVTIDNSLKFDIHVTNLCKKASQKLNALSRISSYMGISKRKNLMKAFITSQFGYCPLVWMFHSRSLNNKINHIHERALRVVYNDKQSSFNELLQKDNSVSIHHRNLQVLATEVYKVIHGLSPEIMKDIFELRDLNYNLRNGDNFATHNIRTAHYGTDTISHLGSRIWRLVPREIKSCESLSSFKSKIKKWVPLNCPCRLCRTYIPNLGFV